MKNLSFSGCGFLIFYHLGVVKAFKDSAPEYLSNEITGSSCGSLIGKSNRHLSLKTFFKL